MSNLLVESPASNAANNQLYFAWDAADCENASSRTAAPVEPSRPLNCEAKANQATQEASAEAPVQLVTRVDDMGVRRIAKPVKIGTVMIKLLKRYGITDEEIAEGLESYASKTTTAIAS